MTEKPKSHMKYSHSLILLKLLVAVSLLGLTWSNMPVQADCPANSSLSATCMTTDDVGNQTCTPLQSFDGDVYCVTSSTPGDGPVHTGCSMGNCAPPDAFVMDGGGHH